MSAEDNPAAEPAEIGEALVAALGFEPTDGKKLGRKAGSSASIADELSEAENSIVEDANDAPSVDDAFSVVSADDAADDVSAASGSGSNGRSGSTAAPAKKATKSNRQRTRRSRASSTKSTGSKNGSGANSSGAAKNTDGSSESKPSLEDIKSAAKPTVSEAEAAAEKAAASAKSEATKVTDTAAEVADDPVAKAKAEHEATRKLVAEKRRNAGLAVDEASDSKTSGSKTSGSKTSDSRASDSKSSDSKAGPAAKSDSEAKAKTDTKPADASSDLKSKSNGLSEKAKSDNTSKSDAGSKSGTSGSAASSKSSKSDGASRSASASTTGSESKTGSSSKPDSASKPGSPTKSGSSTASTSKSESASKSGASKSETSAKSSSSKLAAVAKEAGAKAKETAGATVTSAKAAVTGEVNPTSVGNQPPPPSAGDAIKVDEAAVAKVGKTDDTVPTSPPSMTPGAEAKVDTTVKADSIPENKNAPETIGAPAVAPQAVPTIGRDLSRPTMPELPFPNPFRRKRRVQARKVRRVIRHIDPWSVLTFSVLFHLCVFAALLLSSVLVWNAAEAAGTIENLETFILDLGDYDTYEIHGDVVFKSAVAIAGILTLASSVMLVLLTVVFNLISDLVGGIRLTVIEEETVRVRRRKTRS